MDNESILKIAKDQGLELEQVDSGGRYPLLMLMPGGRKAPVFILENSDVGEGPNEPKANIGIVCYPNLDQWTDGAEALFSNAYDAIKNLADPDFRAALIYQMAGLISAGKTLAAAHAAAVWSEQAEARIKKQDYSYQEMAEEVILLSGAEVILIPHPG